MGGGGGGGRYYVRHIVAETAKGKVLEACLIPVCVYGLGIIALTETREATDTREQLDPKNM